MKKTMYSLAVLAITVAFASCSKDNEQSSDNAAQNLELRAAALGYSDADAYKACVAAQCAAGNHDNCCLLNDGTHCPCPNPDHVGCKHDGTHHCGAAHGKQNANGHSHGQNCSNCNHDGGKHHH